MSLTAAPNTRRNRDAYLALESHASNISRVRTTVAIDRLIASNRSATQEAWLRAVAALVRNLRPDLEHELVEFLEVEPHETNVLADLTIGEISVVYEALLALSDGQSRKKHGQYFTPDDVAQFMVEQSVRFPVDGMWLDPCCGIGNLSWHLAAALGSDAASLVANRLILIDRDPVALKTAIVLLTASFATTGDASALASLHARSYCRDFLAPEPLPAHDFVLMNPPYARHEGVPGYATTATKDSYAIFLERVIREAQGFVAITPASFLSGGKYAVLRTLLGERNGGEVLVFDNVPDTCFRGYKYGSTNTSQTNFVRAAITSSAPADRNWRTTPILRWASRSRPAMFRHAREWLDDLAIGPSGIWAKPMPATRSLWDDLAHVENRLGDMLSATVTPFSLQVASTPRYYISASKRNLDRSSKHVLHFNSLDDCNRAYLVLNSSLAYWWWRCIDGGISLTRRTLLAMPVPLFAHEENRGDLLKSLEQSDLNDVVVKLNAGRSNENVRRPAALVDALNEHIFGLKQPDFSSVYSADLFAEN